VGARGRIRGRGGERAGARVSGPAPGTRAAVLLAAGLLWGGPAAHAQPAPPVAPDSAAGTGARPDPAILWTFDTGG